MPRPPRLDFEGGWFHVMNRGVDHQPVFRDDVDRRLFLDLAAEQPFEIHAYCAMGNHYHLFVHTPDAGLAKSMQTLIGVYTQRFNARHDRDGPVFRGRYKSILVDTAKYLLGLSRYVHLNPVVAGLVASPEMYRWSSYRDYVGLGVAPSWLHTDVTLAEAGGPRAYRDFVESTIPAHDPVSSFYAKQRLGHVLGDPAIAERPYLPRAS